eukprot:CAMPEP_0184322476 /NCGR_PEP_ID=MMETSP1049-20130417/124656_1 /TAXON_ID=77928 /ORGANISM="Proteomonas sulcata, Strain CCMP704" /LENGTH=150 /DNA_ID=CAMNT_0026643625 /DNA_START=29 /DNA_END=478 /DNA_ORIENTATION=+
MPVRGEDFEGVSDLTEGRDDYASHRMESWVGALDGLSPSLSQTSSSESLKGLEGSRKPRFPILSSEIPKRTSTSGSSASTVSAKPKTLTRVQFQVNAATNSGDYVKVVGSVPALGCWQPAAGARLHTDPSSYPMWTGSIEIDSGSLVEYK